MLIISLLQLFHTIIIDFILILFNELNTIFIVIDKFLRRVILCYNNHNI